MKNRGLGTAAKLAVILIVIAAVSAGGYAALLLRNGAGAAFRVGNLSISDPEVKPGQTVRISTDVKNTGGKTGTKDLEFEVGERTEKRSVTLKPGERKTVTLPVSREGKGVYEVAVFGMICRFEVLPDAGVAKKLENVRIMNVFNNYGHHPDLRTSWGFSCLVKTEVKNILFDTGGSGEILMGNMEGIGIDPGDIEAVFLSHIYGDHVGGLKKFLEVNPDVTVYLPESFPEGFKDEVEEVGAELVEVDSPRRIAPGIRSTGELRGPPKEQSLVLSTEKGLVVITGCAHPGIVRIVRRARDLEGDDLHLVMGGFHLGGAPDEELRNIVESFREMGVEKVSPTHCSGDRCRELFEEEYGENYLPDGAGAVIQVAMTSPQGEAPEEN